jgi:hypothetical protein
MIELPLDDRLKVTMQGFGHPDAVSTRYRLAQATANAEPLLNDGIQAFSRRLLVTHSPLSSQRKFCGIFQQHSNRRGSGARNHNEE